MDANKFTRMRNASLNDEDPICLALTALGMPAHKNKDKTLQRKHGDVIFTTTDGLQRSIESQVSKTHTKFSYTLHKVTEYVGVGRQGHAYTMLGCKQSYESPNMFYVVVQAINLHKLILSNRDKYLSNDKKYFVIDPGDLQDLPGLVVAGDTIEQAVNNFARELANHGDL